MTPRPRSPVTRSLLLAGLLTAGAASVPASAAERFAGPERAAGRGGATMPVDSVKAGMVGIGYTVFEGTRVDTFSVAILGVVRAYRPGASLIMGRAMNPTLEKTGIIAGMSGSPVYVNGRLIGAISYTWGFLKEPLAGITPIAEMLDILPGSEGRPPSQEDERLGASDFRGDATSGDATFPLETMRPITTPVMISGFTAEAMRFLDPLWRDRGFAAIPSGAPVKGSAPCDSIVGGSPLGVQLVKGDWNAAALGTVTYRDGKRVLGFGHPFLSMGWVDFPMTGAEVTTIMPSLQISNKVGSATMPCGTLVADRMTGVAGEFGAVPAMIPVRVDIRGAAGRERQYRFDVVRSRLLTPGLIAGASVSALSSLLSEVGLSTVRYDFTSYWNGGARKLSRGDAILTNSPVAGVGEEIAQSLQLLLGDRFRPARLDSATVTIDVAEGIDAWMLTGIRTSVSNAAPGDSIEVEATFRRSSRETVTKRLGIRIPVSAPEGDLSVRVCDGDQTEQWERGRVPQAYEPRTFDDLLGLYARERRADRLYVQLYAATPGVVRNGREIARAPGSVLSVMDGAGKEGEAPVKGATLAERFYSFGRVMRGCETATVKVAADRRR